jgi:hypothetical protein
MNKDAKELFVQFKKARPEDVLPARLFTSPEEGDAPVIMANPSSPQFRAILGLFAGNPGFIPTKAVAKKIA